MDLFQPVILCVDQGSQEPLTINFPNLRAALFSAMRDLPPAVRSVARIQGSEGCLTADDIAQCYENLQVVSRRDMR